MKFLDKYLEFKGKVVNLNKWGLENRFLYFQEDVEEILDKHFVRRTNYVEELIDKKHLVSKQKVKDAIDKFIHLDNPPSENQVCFNILEELGLEE